MRYWVVKAKPKHLWPDGSTTKGDTCKWWGQVPKELSVGDRLFFWKAKPALTLYSLGQLESILPPEKDPPWSFEVRFLTNDFKQQPTIQELKSLKWNGGLPSFLKRGPAGTVFPLSVEEAHLLYRYAVSCNASIARTWNDIKFSPVPGGDSLPDVDESAIEGNVRFVRHLSRERDTSIVKKKKEVVLHKTGKLECEVCGFDFTAAYGELGKGFCEVHHIVPLSQLQKGRRTKLSDLAIICSNCHRMIHRTHPIKNIKQFRRVLKKAND